MSAFIVSYGTMRRFSILCMLSGVAAFAPQQQLRVASTTSTTTLEATWFRQKLRMEYQSTIAASKVKMNSVAKMVEEVETELQILREQVKKKDQEIEQLKAELKETKATVDEAEVVDTAEKAARALLAYRLQLETTTKASAAAVTTMEEEDTTTTIIEKPVMADPADPVIMGSWFRRNLVTTNAYPTANVLESLGSLEGGEAPVSENGMIKPWSEAEEKQRAAKYASIDCIEERTFTILQDLGMVDTSLEFSI